MNGDAASTLNSLWNPRPSSAVGLTSSFCSSSNSICPLQFVTPWQVRADLESNRPIAGQLPSLIDFDVQGNAQLVRINPLPTPSPTGPGHFFAPASGSPTDAVPSA